MDKKITNLGAILAHSSMEIALFLKNVPKFCKFLVKVKKNTLSYTLKDGFDQTEGHFCYHCCFH